MFCLQAFHRWSAPVVNAGQPPVKPKRTKKAIDVSAMAAGTPVKDQDRGRTFDDGTGGDLTIWKIEKFDKVLIDASSHGTFHAGDSYIVQYDYGSSKKDHVIYFWQGRDSTADEKGASALLATALSDSLGGKVPMIRVPMGKEPDHFYSLFRGRMVVRSGGVAGGFRNADEKDTDESSGVALFHVRGTDDVNTRAVQVASDASALNSGDCFVLALDGGKISSLDGKSRVFAWNGRGSSGDERSCAEVIASSVVAPALGLAPSEVEVVDEGSEPDAFWAQIGGKKPYAEFAEGYQTPQEPRLFQVRVDSMRVTLEESHHESHPPERHPPSSHPPSVLIKYAITTRLLTNHPT